MITQKTTMRNSISAAMVLLASVSVSCCAPTEEVQAAMSNPCHLERYIDERALLAVAAAADEATLKKVYGALPVPDQVVKAFYLTRLLETETGDAVDVAFLETLPESQLAFDCLYAVNDTEAWKQSPEVSRLYSAYFNYAARLVSTHPSYVSRFLLMSRFADGEAKYYTDEANETLKELDLRVYLDGLRKLDSESRRYVCGDCPELEHGE